MEINETGIVFGNNIAVGDKKAGAVLNTICHHHPQFDHGL